MHHGVGALRRQHAQNPIVNVLMSGRSIAVREEKQITALPEEQKEDQRKVTEQRR